jgi:hypothetical protein
VVGQPARWSLEYQAVVGNFMTDNVLHSLAATLDTDIVVIRTDAAGQICRMLDHFHARAWAVAGSSEPSEGPIMDAYSSVLWAGGQATAQLADGEQAAASRRTRAGNAAAGRAGRQLTLQQLIAQRQAERRTVTLIYSNGGDHATGHFRAVAKLAMQRTGGSPGA